MNKEERIKELCSEHKKAHLRLKSALRRFNFELLKLFGVFYLMRKLGVEIKQPYKKMYDRVLKN